MSEEVVEAAEASVEAETQVEATTDTSEVAEGSESFSDSFIGSIENEELRTKLEGYNLGGKSADDVAKYLNPAMPCFCPPGPVTKTHQGWVVAAWVRLAGPAAAGTGPAITGTCSGKEATQPQPAIPYAIA